VIDFYFYFLNMKCFCNKEASGASSAKEFSSAVLSLAVLSTPSMFHGEFL
jgi:hypothetical protein